MTKRFIPARHTRTLSKLTREVAALRRDAQGRETGYMIGFNIFIWTYVGIQTYDRYSTKKQLTTTLDKDYQSNESEEKEQKSPSIWENPIVYTRNLLRGGQQPDPWVKDITSTKENVSEILKILRKFQEEREWQYKECLEAMRKASNAEDLEKDSKYPGRDVSRKSWT